MSIKAITFPVEPQAYSAAEVDPLERNIKVKHGWKIGSPTTLLEKKSAIIIAAFLKRSVKYSNLKFIKSIHQKDQKNIKVPFTHEEIIKLRRILEKYENGPIDQSAEEKEIYRILVQLSESPSFNELFTLAYERVVDLEEISSGRIYILYLTHKENHTSKNIKKLLNIYSNLTTERFSTYETSRLLKDEITVFINSLPFKNSLRAAVTDKKYISRNLRILKQLKEFAFEDILFKEEVGRAFEQLNALSLKLKEQFYEDIEYLKITNLNNCSLDSLEKIVAIVGSYNIYSYPTWSYHSICYYFPPKISKNYDFKTFQRNLFVLTKLQEPHRMIKLLQNFEKVTSIFHKVLRNRYCRLQILASSKLVISKEMAINGISQVNFEDKDLNIKSGGANFCCGSISVAALVERSKDLSIENIIKEGVIRHLKLPPTQMSVLTPISMILDVNEDVTQADAGKVKLSFKSTVTAIRYEKFLKEIQNGESGILLVETAAIMLAINEDGSVEVFDSHGSSTPLFSKKTHPAYRAIFKDKTDAAAYLSVHRHLAINQPLRFYPLTVNSR